MGIDLFEMLGEPPSWVLGVLMIAVVTVAIGFAKRVRRAERPEGTLRLGE